MMPGRWTLIATTCRECPAGCGIQMRCKDNRVVKAEGNPQHPVSKGGLCARGQSSIQGEYDPDRLKQAYRPCTCKIPKPGGVDEVKWEAAISEIAAAVGKARRIFLISDVQTGAAAEVMDEFCKSLGKPAEVIYYEPFNYEALRNANRGLFRQAVIPHYKLDKSEFILSFGTDFLETWISNVEFAADFSKMHHSGKNHQGQMAYIGPRMSMTAANADYFHLVPPGQETAIALAILKTIIDKGWARNSDEQLKNLVLPALPREVGVPAVKIEEYAMALARSKGGVVLAGQPIGAGRQAEELAAAAMLINYTIGSIGEVIDFGRPHSLSKTLYNEELHDIFKALDAEDMIIFHNINSAYNLPDAQEQIQKAGYRVYIGTMMNETARLCSWMLAEHSPVESWGDYEPYAGVHCLMQPCMHPLYESRQAGDILISLANACGKTLNRQNRTPKTFLEWLICRWQELAEDTGEANFNEFWQNSLRNGVLVRDVKGGQPKLTDPVNLKFDLCKRLTRD